MKKIFILANAAKDPDGAVADRVAALLRSEGCETEVSADLSSVAQFRPDLAVVLGGDGSIMRAADAFAPKGVPILGINLGRVGYMTELEKDEIELLREYLAGRYTVEERMMLEVECGGEKGLALNDAVISNGAISKMTSLTLYCGDMKVSGYHADGLIIATPTGSTAYSMSAGGPIIDPSVGCLLVTPVCSQSLTSRPVVFSGDTVLRVVNESRGKVNVYLTLDGARNLSVPDGGEVRIRRSEISASLVRIKNDGFYGRLAKKLY